MISYEEALVKAKELKPTIDTATEYENGYVFGCQADDDYIGGGHSPVVILKTTGEAKTFPWFIGKYGAGKRIKEYSL